MKHTVMSGIFSSADPADVIRKVRITGSILDEPLCEYLDATLSNLPAPPILEFAYDGATYEGWTKPYLPLLSAKKLVRLDLYPLAFVFLTPSA
jgi:hypothetical protein